MKTSVIWVLFVCLDPKFVISEPLQSDYESRGLTSIPGNVICNPVMRFRYNQITSITSTDFRSCTGLNILTLDHNKISYIAPNAFDNNPILYMLTVGHNPIQIFPYYPVIRNTITWLATQQTSISSTTWDGVVPYTKITVFYMSSINIGNPLLI